MARSLPLNSPPREVDFTVQQINADGTLVSSGGFLSSATFTPAAAAYAAGDIMQGAVQFSNIGPSGGGAIILSNTRLRVDANAVQSGETSYTLQL